MDHKLVVLAVLISLVGNCVHPALGHPGIGHLRVRRDDETTPAPTEAPPGTTPAAEVSSPAPAPEATKPVIEGRVMAPPPLPPPPPAAGGEDDEKKRLDIIEKIKAEQAKANLASEKAAGGGGGAAAAEPPRDTLAEQENAVDKAIGKAKERMKEGKKKKPRIEKIEFETKETHSIGCGGLLGCLLG